MCDTCEEKQRVQECKTSYVDKVVHKVELYDTCIVKYRAVLGVWAVQSYSVVWYA